jgi:hypothetical protein
LAGSNVADPELTEEKIAAAMAKAARPALPDYGKLGDPPDPDRCTAAPVSRGVPQRGTHIVASQHVAAQAVPAGQSLDDSQIRKRSQVSND